MSDNTVMLVQVSATSNANKYYEMTLSGDTVHARYGRVGVAGQRKTYPGGQRKFDQLLREKTRHGYKQVGVVGGSAGSGGAASTEVLRTVATSALAGTDPAVVAVVDYLVAKNAHDIKVASGGKIVVKDGAVTTALGPVTAGTILRARQTLATLSTATGPARVAALEEYLTLIPQKVGSQRGWHENFLVTQRDRDEQQSFLDQLEASVQLVTTSKSAVVDPADAFRYSLVKVTDKAVIAKIAKDYAATANSVHTDRVTKAKVKAVFEVRDNRPDMLKAVRDTAARLGNVQRLWHGTRAHNVLSILSTGMVKPGTISTAQRAGAMFGNGLYFSDQSTKSAGYAAGGVWSSGVDNRWFMLVADVATGWQNRPNITGITRHNDVLAGKVTDPATGRTFNSINVKAGTCGVRNHELIVGSPEQVNLRYLVEFGS